MKTTILATAAAIAVASATTAVAVEPSLSVRNDTHTPSTTRRLTRANAYRLKGADVVGKDLPSQYVTLATSDFCFKYCALMAENMGVPCSAATWTPYNGGTCWPKATGFVGTPTTPKVEAESFLFLGDATSSFIWSDTKEGFDMAGYDIANTRRANMGQCMGDCNANTNCFAVVWTDYEGGACWLKSRASGYVAKPGAKAAFMARKTAYPIA